MRRFQNLQKWVFVILDVARVNSRITTTSGIGGLDLTDGM
jgi:hypothetical protein